MARKLKLVADENIASLQPVFSSLASIEQVSGRSLCADDIRGADALLVRSVTQVDESLLENSSVKFVGSATIGTDHIALDYLAANGIHFCHAPGSNADSVADYLCSALAALVPDLGSVASSGLSAGIIGYGEVGSRLAGRLQTLGYQVCAHDPFLESASVPLRPLDEVLGFDLVSVNVPLTFDGEHPTYRLLNPDTLRQLSNRCILLNTSRGDVIDGAALANWLRNRPGAHAVLDVWQGEPNIDPELAELVSIASPHIAGYALDGKLRGTEMLAAEFCRHFDLNRVPGSTHLAQRTVKLSGTESLNEILLRAYDIREDDNALRKILRSIEPGLAFDQLRKSYPERREYGAHKLAFASPPKPQLLQILLALGFHVD